MPPANGEVLKRPTDPLDVPEIAALLAEIGNDARQVTAVSDLRPLRRKLTKLTADILPDNREVMRICEKLGFTLKHSLDDEVVRAEFAL